MTGKKQGAGFFPALFLLIGLLFVGILGFAYRIARKADPVMLDEQGHVQGTRHP